MKKFRWMLLVLTWLTLPACSSLVKLGFKPQDEKIERVGILLVQNCGQSASCHKYSLLESGLQNRSVILAGDISSSLKGRLIAVLGKEMVKRDGLEVINVEKTRAITEFDYQPFLAEAVSSYTRQQYSCESLWDQSYAWRLDDRQPMLVTLLTHPGKSGTQLRLEYDGLTKTLASAKETPEGINPCRLN
jgi:hypothetical protein